VVIKTIQDPDKRWLRYVEIDVTTIAETEDAVLLDCGFRKPNWIPKSAMEDWPDLNANGIALIAVWFAEKEGLV